MDNSAQCFNSSLADALFGKTKKAVISFLFARPDSSWHLRELARAASVSPTMLSKEADLLVSAGIVLEERDGNRRVFRADPNCPIFEELRGIARKTGGVADIVRNAIDGVKGVRLAFIFGSVARGEERSGSDIDVCVLANESLTEISKALSAIEPAVGRPINPMVYSDDELREKVESANPFIARMMASPKIFLIGDQSELDQAT